MKELTKAEEEVMQILWHIRKGFVKDIIEHFTEPKPAYNTVSTIVRILEKKGFVAYTAYGKSHEYYPLIARDNYKSFFLKNFMSGYFGGSFGKLVSFFAKDNNLNVQELDQLMQQVKGELNQDNDDGEPTDKP
ncbi:BlaI/MecI/CopY family transcriptional regulator [Botryobacter ruber]|uniref:BlaI/MecI/CopY family transcriptional regulator n=1 Tax=Botryobacter ruber TaxID=2171629 RepID=UPI000E0B8FD6|nr:BlaI/MecI/CopY family transcriptional regulator [Botryobacter ruber]